MAKKEPYCPVPDNYQEVIDNWPPMGGLSLDVRPGDRWDLLALKYGYLDPRALCYYNFRTYNPKFINYWMKHLLGCNIITKNGKNFRFGKQVGTDVEPVTIFIPQPDWQPTPDPVHPVEPVPMDDVDHQLADKIVEILGSTYTKNIYFTMSGHTVGPALFENVRRLVANGAISVNRVSDGAEHAWYNPNTNCFCVKWPSTDEKKAMIVHEAVHAGFDYEQVRNIRQADGEAAAYLAETLYYRAKTKCELIGTNINNIIIFEECNKLADALHDGRMPTRADTQILRNAIYQHPEYNNAHLWLDYDGIYE